MLSHLIIFVALVVAIGLILLARKEQNAAKPANAEPKWHLIYYALASFDIITVLISLILNHQIVQIHISSVDLNGLWSARRDALIALSIKPAR